MIFDNLFAQNKIIGTAMNAAMVRSNVINNNIANADVPGFTKSVVDFENTLARELNDAKTTGTVNIDNLKPTVNYSMQGFNYRIDGNNVDVETEMVELYQNSAKYDVMTSSLMNNYKRINLVMSGIR